MNVQQTAAPVRQNPFGQGEESEARQSPEIVVEQVFLSPRVVDRRAFGELSGELRRLVERAAAERAAMGEAVERAAASAREALRGEAAQQENLELTARALKRLEDRIATADRAAAQLADASGLVERFDTRAEVLVAGKVEAMEARLAALQGGAAARIEAMEERLAGALRELEQRIAATRRDAESVAGPSLGSLKSVVARAEDLLGRAADSPADVAPRSGSLGDALRRAESARESAELAVRLIEGALARANDRRESADLVAEESRRLAERLDLQRGDLSAQVEAVRAEFERAAASIESRLTACKSGAESVIEEIKPLGERAAAAAARACADVESLDRRTEESAALAGAAVKDAERAASELDQVLRALEPWRGVLLCGSTPHELPGPVQAVVDGVRRELGGHLAGIAGALREAATTAERAACGADGEATRPAGWAQDFCDSVCGAD